MLDQQGIDYDALAKKVGGTSVSAPSQPDVDYDALAKKVGATVEPLSETEVMPLASGVQG